MEDGHYDFAKDVDPVKFVLDERISFLHGFVKYVNLLKRLEIEDEKFLRIGRMMARYVNNYRLVLNSSHGRMPDKKAESLLSVLGESMDKIWENRNTENSDMRPTADKVIMGYESLFDYISTLK